MQTRSSAAAVMTSSQNRLRKKSTTARPTKKDRLPIVLCVRLRLYTFSHPPTPACLRLVAAIFAVFTPRFVAPSPAFRSLLSHAGSALSCSATARLMAFSRSELRMRQATATAYPGLYSKDLRNFGGRLSCQEQVLDLVFLGSAFGHAFASLWANSALSWGGRQSICPPPRVVTLLTSERSIWGMRSR